MSVQGSRRGGVVLILFAGMTGLFLLMGLLVLWIARGQVQRSDAILQGSALRVCAESGLAYAAARLCADPFPFHGPDAASRTGDWTERQGAGGRDHGSENPSYARGEPWTDGSGVADGIDNDGDELIDEPGETDRIFVPGEPFADLDGDGRRSAWSGRVRGGAGARGLRFALKIESSEGKIPVNAGKGLPSTDPRNVGLAFAFNNLGAILRPVSPGDTTQTGGWTRRWRIPAGVDTDADGKPDGEAIEASRLGEDLVAGRPAGGYREWGQVREVLAGLGYRPDEVDLFRPHLALGGGPPRGEGGRSLTPSCGAPLNAWTVSQAVLESHWRYLVSSPPLWTERPTGQPRATIVAPDFPCEADGRDEISPLAKLPFTDFTVTYSPPYMRSLCLILFPTESARLAEEVGLFRQRREGGWHALRERLHRRSPVLFWEDFQALASATPAPADVMKWSWAAAKANLAFQAAAVDPYPAASPQLHPSAAWSTWGIDADRDQPGIQPAMSVSVSGITRIRYPFSWSPGSPAPWGIDPASPFRANGRGPSAVPLGLTLAAPVRFEASSRAAGADGGTCTLEGSLLAGDLLELSGQEDFERFRSFSCLSASGIEALDLPSAAQRKDGAAGFRPNIVTLPDWDKRSVGGGTEFGSVGGAVGPAPAEIGSLGSAQLYWSFTQDFDPTTVWPPPPWREFWSDFQAAPTPPWETGGGLPPPPYSCIPQPAASGPYGISQGPFGIQVPGMFPAFLPVFGGVTFNSIRGMSIEVWMGTNASVVVGHASSSSRIVLSTRRGSRNGGRRLGTEYSIFCLWGVWDSPSGAGGTDHCMTRRWLVEDPPAGAPWTRHVVLTLERVPSGLAMPAYKTRFRLYADGSSGSADGSMEFLFDGTDPVPPFSSLQLPPICDMGEMICGGEKRVIFQGVDEVRLYNRALGGDPGVPPRYVPAGIFQSPLYALDAAGRLALAQWTGFAPDGCAIDVRVRGYRDAWGLSLAGEVPLADPSRPADLAALGMPDGIRSFRYVVELRSGSLAEPPLFESIWLLLRRRGQSPAWTGWGCR